jgi:hypothetical protein
VDKSADNTGDAIKAPTLANASVFMSVALTNPSGPQTFIRT